MASDLALLALVKKIEGITGPAGPAGAVGPAGPAGPAGPTGAVGPQGPNGKDGREGPQGPKGEQGPQGPAGADGFDGKDGIDGVGVESVSQAADGDLVFTLTDGTEYVIELPYGLSGGLDGNTFIVGQGPKTTGGGVGLNLDESALNPNNGDILQFDASTNLWKAVPAAFINATYQKFKPLDAADLVTANGNILYSRVP